MPWNGCWMSQPDSLLLSNSKQSRKIQFTHPRSDHSAHFELRQIDRGNNDDMAQLSFLPCSISRRLFVERREYPRYYVSLTIEIKEVSSSFPLRGTTTDVSLGGCYVATIFPIAVGFQIYFTMQVAGGNIKGRGSVQTCHAGVGMGIRFFDLMDEDRLRLDEYLHASVPFSTGR